PSQVLSLYAINEINATIRCEGASQQPFVRERVEPKNSLVEGGDSHGQRQRADRARRAHGAIYPREHGATPPVHVGRRNPQEVTLSSSLGGHSNLATFLRPDSLSHETIA